MPDNNKQESTHVYHGNPNDIAACEEKIRELRKRIQKLEREDKYPEALALCHEIDDVQAHISVLRNTTIDKKCVREYSIPRGIHLIN